VLEAKHAQNESAKQTDARRVVPGAVVAERYRLDRVLGTGGMGTVWLAHDVSLDTECALKLIDAEKAKIDEVRVRFEREAKASAQLRGAHVVDVFDYGVWEEVPFIAMELLEGEDLAQRLERVQRLSFEETYRVVAHVCRALAKAHSRGIVHRDLKPENIFIVDTGAEEIAKVLDFGIAKHEGYSVGDKTTKLGSFLGTPHYVSPEQARGQFTDGRADLWGVGVIAFQCITGRLPFHSESMGSLMGQILYDKMPIPSQVDETIPAEFDAWWARAASRNPDDRFQAAHEMSDALAKALGIETVLTVPSMPPRSSSVPSIPPPNVTLKAVNGGVAGEMAVTQDGPVDSLASAPRLPENKTAGEIDVRASGEFAAGTARRDYTPDDQPATRNVTVVSSRRMWAAIHAKRNATLYAVLGLLLILIVTAIAFVGTRGSETDAPPPAADVTLTPTREPAGVNGSEAKPSTPESETAADKDAPDLVRPDDLEIEQPPEKLAPKGAPRRWQPPAKPQPAQPANPGGPDYGI